MNAGEMSLEALRDEIEEVRERISRLVEQLSHYFVGKREIVELLAVSTAAQEPLLLVGPPGTAKSDLVARFCQALGLGDDDYFEYMLTKFTEPSELLGPIDIDSLKRGRYTRHSAGKLPTAKVAFLDEIFKSNSAILNTLLTVINERKYYQDGRPLPVALVMLFAATNHIPQFEELAALRDRFPLKAESRQVKDFHFDELVEKGVANDIDRALGRTPWAGLAHLDDFLKVKRYLDLVMAGMGERGGADPNAPSPVASDRRRTFPDEVYQVFKQILRTLEREDGVALSDRKVVKLYRIIRTRAFLLHGGAVRKEDLAVLRYVGERTEDLPLVREKVDSLLRLA